MPTPGTRNLSAAPTLKILPQLLVYLSLSILPCFAQERPGEVLVGGLRDTTGAGGGLWLIGQGLSSPQPLRNQPAVLRDTYSIRQNPLDRTQVYVGTYAPTGQVQLLEVRAASGAVLSTRTLNQGPITTAYLLGVVRTATHLIYVGRDVIGAIPIQGGTPVVLQQFSSSLVIHAMTSDGEGLYVSRGVDIWRFDLDDLQAAPRLVVTLPSGAFSLVHGLDAGSAGVLYAVSTDPWAGVTLYEVEIATGARLRSLTLPLLSARAVAFDQRTTDILVAGALDLATSGVLVIRGWNVAGTLGSIPNALPGLSIRRSLPLHRIGHSCLHASGVEPRLVGNSVPYVGNASYGITIETNPQATGVLYFNLPSTYAGLPLDGYGATGCEAGILGWFSVPVHADAVGEAFVPLAVPSFPSALGMQVAMQAYLADPGANAAGWVSTQTGIVVIEG